MKNGGRSAALSRPQQHNRIQTLVEDYLVECQAKGLSPSTLRAYRWSLRDILLPWCQERDLETVDQLDQRELNRLGNELLTRPGRRRGVSTLSEHTVTDYLKPIRQWLVWCEEEVGLETAGRPRMPRLHRPVVQPLSRQEILAMEDAATSERDKLMIRLLGDVGLRIGELCKLKVEDLMLDPRTRKWYLHIHGKGGNERRVGVPYLGPRLKRYLKYRPQSCSDHMFLTLRANPDGWHDGVGLSGVRRVINLLADTTGLKRRVYPHLLRHSAITNLHGKGMNSFQVGTVVGNHNHLAAYTHLQAEDTYESLRELLVDD